MNNKILKLSIGIGILIFASAMAFYLIIYLPKQALKKECEIIASKHVDDDRYRSKNGIGGIRLYPPTYEDYYYRCLQAQNLQAPENNRFDF